MKLTKRLLLERERLRNVVRRERHELVELFWECTLRCNLHCQHCGSDCKAVEAQPDMPLADFLPVLDDVAAHYDASRITVVTTGGEPMMRSDILDVGRAITGRGFLWGMVSNGLRMDEAMVGQLAEAGLKTVGISLDGFEAAHNWMRGNGQSFATALRAIRALRQTTITWDVITCVNQRNVADLARFRDFLIGEGVPAWRIFTVFPAGRAKGNAELQLSGEQLRGVMDFIRQTRREGRIDLNFSCEGWLGDYELEVRDAPFFCFAGVNVASVLCDGSISGCLSIRSDYDQGNIYRDRFSDVWEQGFAPYRDHGWMRTGACRECKAWRWCEGNGLHLRDEGGGLIACNYLKMKLD